MVIHSVEADRNCDDTEDFFLAEIWELYRIKKKE